MSEAEEEKPLHELKPERNFPVVKANKLIESSYKLSLQEQRIVLSLISKIRKEDRDFQWYKVRISKLAKFLGIDKNKNIRKELRDNIRALMGKVITVKGIDKDIDLHWIDAADYGVKGYVKISVHKELKPYLLDLKSHFTRYCLKYVIDFKSSYSIRLYEILKRFEHNGEVTLGLEKIKKMLGFRDTEYSLYANLKAWVLLVAQREISEKTDISFTFEEIREWKKVLALRFIIKPNTEQKLTSFVEFQPETVESEEFKKQPELDFFEALSDDTPEHVKSMLHKIPDSYKKSKAILASVQYYLKTKGLDYVERNIVYSNKKSNAVNPLSNPGQEANYISFLTKSLEKDWALVPPANQQVKIDAEEKIKPVSKVLIKKNTDPGVRPATLEIQKDAGESEENILRLIALLPPKFQKLQSIQKVIQHYYHREYDFDFVARSIKYSNVKSNAVKPGTNPNQPANYCAYLSQTLAGDFGLSFQENEEMNAAAKNRKTQIRRDAEEAKRKENERQARDSENRTKAEAILQTLSEYELEALRKQAIERLPAELKTSPYSSMSIKMEVQKIVLERAAQQQQPTLQKTPPE